MKIYRRLLPLGLFLMFWVVATQGAQASQRCSLCGMDVDESETAYYVKMEKGRMYPLCSLQCVYMLLLNAKEKAVSIRTEDYSTSRLMDAPTAHFLYESRLIPKGSMMPYLLAFSSRDQAIEFQKKYGGRLLDFDSAMAIVKQEMTKPK